MVKKKNILAFITPTMYPFPLARYLTCLWIMLTMELDLNDNSAVHLHSTIQFVDTLP